MLPGSRKCLGQLQPWSPAWVNRIRNRFQSLKEDAVRRRHIRGGGLADQASIRQDLNCERHASLASSSCVSTPLPLNGFTLNTKPDRGIYVYEVGLRPVTSILRKKRNKLGRAVALSLLLPLLLVALVPQGFMPTISSEGWFTVTLCTTDGLRTVTLDENGQEVPDPAGQSNDQAAGEHCLFSTLTVFAAPFQADPHSFPVVRKSDDWPVTSSDAPPVKFKRPPSARAPPSLA
jgi:DUF2946 family protein